MKPDLEVGGSAAARPWIGAGWGRDQERTGLGAFTHLYSQHSAMLPFPFPCCLLPGMSPQPFKLNLFITSSYFISFIAFITTFRHFLSF